MQRLKIPFICLCVCLLTVATLSWLSSGPADAQRRIPPPSKAAVQYSYAPIVKQAAPAVVNVYVRRRVEAFNSPFADDPFFRRFFGERFGMPSDRIQSSLGSGVIVSPDGVVITNTHVIKGRGATEIRIALADKREFDARVLSQDEKTDIAILKIENADERFPAIELEDSDTLEVGDLVLAIGNPFGVGQTVTSGIISAQTRSGIGRSDSQVFIQTDAAINPGNSGGALVDMSGKLVGINTMIFSQSGGSHGIGFAIPSNLVRVYLKGATTGKKVERPWLGASLEPVNREIAEGLGLDRAAGAMVARIRDKGPAAKAGLKAGDVIIKVDDFDVPDPRSVNYRLTTRGTGSTVTLSVIRRGKTITVKLPLVAAPKPGRGDVKNMTGNHPFDGARVSNILPGIADELELDDEGVVILSVRRASVAARLGFRRGDVVERVNRSTIRSLNELEQALNTRPRYWQVDIKRGREVLHLRVPG